MRPPKKADALEPSIASLVDAIAVMTGGGLRNILIEYERAYRKGTHHLL